MDTGRTVLVKLGRKTIKCEDNTHRKLFLEGTKTFCTIGGKLGGSVMSDNVTRPLVASLDVIIDGNY